MKNINENLRGATGFMSLFSIFIIVLVLAIAGTFLWQKYQSMNYPEGSVKDPMSYIIGIKDKIGSVQEKQEEQTNRARELTENTQAISDKGNSFTIDVPASWKLAVSEGSQGNQVSKTVVESMDFKTHISNSNIIYDRGVQMTVQVTRGTVKNFQSADGGHGKLFIENQEIEIGSSKGILHVYKSFDGSDQQILDAHLVDGGNTYLFQFAYNSEIVHTGKAPFQFKEILISTRFKSRK